MEHGEALNVLAQLRILYNCSPNMKEPNVESAAKYMMKQCEEGLRLAHTRRQEEYISDLQAQLKAAEGEAASLKKALEAIQIAEYADEIDKIAEQALKEKEDV